MILKKEFYNIKCDCCGQILDDENYWDEMEGIESMLDPCCWKTMEDGKHYCPDCIHYDDNDMLQWNIKAEVGQKFSKQFAQQKQAQKVRVTSTANVVDADEEPAAEPGNGGNGGSNPPSGGGENEE